jgi:hypothetical protein
MAIMRLQKQIHISPVPLYFLLQCTSLHFPLQASTQSVHTNVGSDNNVMTFARAKSFERAATTQREL